MLPFTCLTNLSTAFSADAECQYLQEIISSRNHQSATMSWLLLFYHLQIDFLGNLRQYYSSCVNLMTLNIFIFRILRDLMRIMNNEFVVIMPLVYIIREIDSYINSLSLLCIIAGLMRIYRSKRAMYVIVCVWLKLNEYFVSLSTTYWVI